MSGGRSEVSFTFFFAVRVHGTEPRKTKYFFSDAPQPASRAPISGEMLKFSGSSVVAALLIAVVFGSFFFCEYLIYFPTILKCAWPKLSYARGGEGTDGRPTDSAVRAMVLSDTHLLGAVGGHWEWQMERAFQTALWLLKPEIVFILGDIFDEGKWSSQKVTELHVFPPVMQQRCFGISSRFC
ncbi:hypothetical protein GOODEAATRI_003934 [Goodea atripinnis]|uniref:Calcineurin-like phosphoesterase domain-containing protein n=1 Tax=Goodea atripinnis TaxID=208336 RepID=A0ABV0PVB7_9TELE